MNFKNKMSTNQNLIPSSFHYQYLAKCAVVPCLIAFILAIAVVFGSSYLIPAVTNFVEVKTNEILEKSLVQENERLKSNIAALNADTAKKKAEYENYYVEHPVQVDIDTSNLDALLVQIEQLKDSLAKALADRQDRQLAAQKEYDRLNRSLIRYQVNELFRYINDVRNNGVTIISLEDAKSYSAGKTSDSSGSDNATDSNSSYLIYENDIGETAFSIHGIATLQSDLVAFLDSLNKCEFIKSSTIVSVETQTITEDVTAQVFEVSIVPNIGSIARP